MRTILLLMAFVVITGDVAVSLHADVILTKSGRLLDGTVSLTDTAVVVLTSDGPHVLSRQDVVYRGASRDDVYEHLATDAISPESRLTLARWCLKNSLQPQALFQCDQTLKMSPGNVEAALLMKEIKSVGSTPSESEKDQPPPERPHGLQPATIGRFNRAIVPTLRSSCSKSGCHGHESDRTFVIRQAVYRSDRTATLDSAVSQINTLDPLKSPLLLYAMTPHGGMENSPLKGRLAPKQIQNLAAWVTAAAAEVDRTKEISRKNSGRITK